MLNSVLTFGYLIWLHIVFYRGGFWVYPVFKVLSGTTRPFFMAFCILLGFAFYFLGERLNMMLWGQSKEEIIRKKLPAKKIKKQRKDQ